MLKIYSFSFSEAQEMAKNGEDDERALRASFVGLGLGKFSTFLLAISPLRLKNGCCMFILKFSYLFWTVVSSSLGEKFV